MSSVNIKITRGQAASLTFSFNKQDGTAFNLAGCSVHLTILNRPAAIAPVVSRNGVISGSTAAISLSGTETTQAVAAYWSTLTLTDSSGVESRNRHFYVYITEEQVGDSNTSIVVGDDNVGLALTVEQPSNTVDKLYRQDFPTPITELLVTNGLNKRPSV